MFRLFILLHLNLKLKEPFYKILLAIENINLIDTLVFCFCLADWTILFDYY